MAEPDVSRLADDAETVLAIEAVQFYDRWSKFLDEELHDTFVTEISALVEVSMNAMMLKTVKALQGHLRPDPGEQR